MNETVRGALREPREQDLRAAKQSGLIYVSDADPGISRRTHGSRFTYVRPDGSTVRDEPTLKRIRSLAIPPAYTNVWICARPDGHIQATGRDAKGRKQYRYHPLWTQTRDADKYEHMIEFAMALPALRAQLDADMRKRELVRDKVLATIVHLLETTLIRVGNEDYAQDNKSYGLTTLRNRHVHVEQDSLRFRFKGKSGKHWDLDLSDRRVARVVRACQDLPGQHLFEYIDDEGAPHPVESADVNAYLRGVTGKNITAKDFRTWHGTVLAAMALREFEKFDSQAHAKKQIRVAIERVASQLGNTPSICRKCYVHPYVLDSYLDGRLLEEIGREIEAELREDLALLKPEEAAVLAFLENRVKRARPRNRPARGRGSRSAPTRGISLSRAAG